MSAGSEPCTNLRASVSTRSCGCLLKSPSGQTMPVDLCFTLLRYASLAQLRQRTLACGAEPDWASHLGLNSKVASASDSMMSCQLSVMRVGLCDKQLLTL